MSLKTKAPQYLATTFALVTAASTLSGCVKPEDFQTTTTNAASGVVNNTVNTAAGAISGRIGQEIYGAVYGF